MFISAALLLLLLAQPSYGAQPREPKRVLILYSDDKSDPAHEVAEQGIREVFRSSQIFDVQLFTEYLDEPRFGDPAHARTMAEFLRRKYSGVQIDAIITVYEYALRFLLAERRTLFPEVPIVACRISRSYAGNLEIAQVRRFVTGTVVPDELRSIIGEALRLKPKTKRIAMVGGTAAQDIVKEQIFRSDFKHYAGSTDLIDLTTLSMEETLSRVAALPPDTLVFYTSILRDGAGKVFVPREALSLVAKASQVPVFSIEETHFGFGSVGGRLVSSKEHGKEAAAMALRIMGGESPASIPFGGEKAYVDEYDWRELKRWGIKEASLPPESVVKYKEFSAWDLYKWYIIAGILFIALETCIVILLVVLDRKRKRAQEALQILMADLESRVQERTKELSEANESLQAANKELDGFTYSVSHDLRAPLRAIDGFSMMVLEDYADKLDDEGRRKLGVIRSSTQKMGQLIDDLLAFSRLGRKEMVNAPIDMEALVRGAWTELSVINPGRRLQLSVQSLPHATGDQTLIKEVVLNLLSNAVKFTKHRQNAIVEVGAYPEGQTNVYFVKDNGAGFDMQYYDKLFGVFQRLHSADEFEGTGVGLAIVERIIHRHGGRVWAKGKVDEGATFYFTLAKE